jgi:hypothetical protein
MSLLVIFNLLSNPRRRFDEIHWTFYGNAVAMSNNFTPSTPNPLNPQHLNTFQRTPKHAPWVNAFFGANPQPLTPLVSFLQHSQQGSPRGLSRSIRKILFPERHQKNHSVEEK